MKKKSAMATFTISRAMMAVSVLALAACVGSNDNGVVMNTSMQTPTVDYVEQLDVYSAPHQDSFLNQLAMNYRSYAIYNARTSGYADMGELFAQKAVAAFSGELPFPESLENWPVDDEQVSFELYNAYNDLLEQLKNDASDLQPQLAAEAQAKYDCWLSAAASGQTATAASCRNRFNKAMNTLKQCDKPTVITKKQTSPKKVDETVNGRQMSGQYYSRTREMAAVRTPSVREGVIVVNNVNVPEHLINPVPVQPMVFNQNIFSDDKPVTRMNGLCADADCSQSAEIPTVSEELVTREEFINMMMAMRAELAAINARLDDIQATAGEKTMIKVQQIPLEPKQHVMEEVFEVRFDFDKATIKPEYQELIRKLATATQENKNIRVSVVGHTDTMGSASYNYALGGRRAEAVQKMLIKYGIPASQIVAVSAGEEDLAVPTADGVANAANRRVRVVKEVHYTEPANRVVPIEISVEDISDAGCGMYGCIE